MRILSVIPSGLEIHVHVHVHVSLVLMWYSVRACTTNVHVPLIGDRVIV